jgi:hypothetical protein
MNLKTAFTHLALAAAIGGLALAPAESLAQGKGKGKGKGNKESHWNPAPPKQNGRHDNRDWNKGKNKKNDDWRRDDDRWRREEERRRNDDWRRQEDERRRQEFLRQDVNRDGRIDQRDLDALSNRRQQTKNEWRNLAIAAGAVAVLGVLQKDNRLVFAGAAGALYSLHRYEQDRKSQSQVDRARAAYFSQPYFYRDGVRYDRRLVTKNGDRYYQFVRR